jgi:hypothetical protein
MAGENDSLLPRSSTPSRIPHPIKPRSPYADDDASIGTDKRAKGKSFGSKVVLFTTVVLSVCVVILCFAPEGWKKGDWGHNHPGPLTIEQRVNFILGETPLIDGHNDLAIYVRSLFDNHIYEKNFTVPFEQGGLVGHVDLPRLKKGKNGGAFWSAFVPCPADGLDFSKENYAKCKDFILNAAMSFLLRGYLCSFLHQSHETNHQLYRETRSGESSSAVTAVYA